MSFYSAKNNSPKTFPKGQEIKFIVEEGKNGAKVLVDYEQNN